MERKIFPLGTVLVCVAFFLVGFANTEEKKGSFEYDVLIKNGKVLDGSLKPALEPTLRLKVTRSSRLENP